MSEEIVLEGFTDIMSHTLSETITIQLHCALKYDDPGMALLMYWINMK